MDDVELADVSGQREGLLCAGPNAAAVLLAAGIETDGLQPLQFKTMEWSGKSITVIHAYSPLVPRFEVWAEGDDAASTVAAITSAVEMADAVGCPGDAVEYLRMLEGTPRYGVDIRDRELPQETNQTRALHFAKGCYLGQEIVERIRSRGNVHRAFQAFELTEDLPAAGVALELDGKVVGELTSVMSVPLADGAVQLGLGYIRREALERGGRIAYAGGEALPVPTPFLVVERSA
jgi:aminomethyltransferase